MRITLVLLLAILPPHLLVSCASLSKHECKVGDWHKIGKRDGAEGHALKQFDEHKKACEGHGFKANYALYKKGREEGLTSYCTIQRQLDLGIEGTKIKPVCKGAIVPLLREANAWGYRGFEVKYNLWQTNDQLSVVREKLSDNKTKDAERERLLDEERRLLDEVDRLRLELVRMKAEAEKTLSQKAKAFYGTN